MNFTRYAGVWALLFAIVVPAAAQQPPQSAKSPAGPDAPRPRMLSVEAALRHKDDLKLSDAQQAQLEALRKEIVAERQTHARDRIDLQSRLMAGLISRDEVRKQLEGRRDAMRQTVEQRQDRISQILTEAQQDQLRQATRRHMMDRMRERRGGRGFRPSIRGRGFRNGFGPGFGPGRGFGDFDN